MIGFFVKKAFFDAWDNLFLLILHNLVIIALAGLFIFLPYYLRADVLLNLGLQAAGAYLISVWFSLGVTAFVKIADFKSVRLADIKPLIVPSLITGLHLFIALVLLWVSLRLVMPFYLSMGNLIGYVGFGVAFWIAFLCVLGFQYYLPLRARAGGGIAKNLKQSFALFFDNPGFSVYLFFYNFFCFAISIFAAFLIPGLAGVALALDVAIRLRMKKYTYLKSLPPEADRTINWEELFREDREMLGKRSLKGMIFPWKE